ncbi:MAG: quinol:electron acceptor oxidoreductase subunit ActD [Nitrospinota bacterium]
MDYYTILGLYDRVDDAAETIKPLEDGSIVHDDIKVLSVAPYPDGTFFKDDRPSPIWAFALGFGIIGFLVGLALAGWTQTMMNLNVGAKPPLSLPVVALLTYETTMLGAVLGALFGMLWMIGIPNWNERVYDESISQGAIGLLVRCTDKSGIEKVEKIMRGHRTVKIKYGQDDF